MTVIKKRNDTKNKLNAVSETRLNRIHIGIIVVGSIALLAGAFHNNLWFDEAYSVAIAKNTFTDIFRIGAADVHPVLYYWALHVLNLIFGENLAIYRLFTLTGSVLMAVLGYTHLRRDINPVTGALFSFLALFAPYTAHMAVELRMYSWCAFTVMACFIYTQRICHAIQKHTEIPRHWWIIFHIASFASADLHYFGAFTAFLLNAAILTTIIRRRPTHHEMLSWLIGAIVQIALYSPWIGITLSQVNQVSHGFWIQLKFPESLIQFTTFPFITQWTGLTLSTIFGTAPSAGWTALYITANASMTTALVGLAITATTLALAVRAWVRIPACRAGLSLYGIVVLFGAVASLAMGTVIIHYRYLYVVIGPLLLGLATAICSNTPATTEHNKRNLIGRKPLVCAAIISVLWLASTPTLLANMYSPANEAPRDLLTAANTNEVWSQESTAAGVLATMPNGPRVHYVDKWSTAAAYKAFGFSITPADDWGKHKSGERLYIMERRSGYNEQASEAEVVKSTTNLTRESTDDTFEIINTHAAYRPYEDAWYVLFEVQVK